MSQTIIYPMPCLFGAVIPFFDSIHIYAVVPAVCVVLLLASAAVHVKLSVCNSGAIYLTLVPALSCALIITLMVLWNGATREHFSMIICSLTLTLMNLPVLCGQISYSHTQLKTTMLKTELEVKADEAEYYKLLQDSYSDRRKLIHDIRNHLQTITLMAHRSGDVRVEDYVRELSSLPALNSSPVRTSSPHLNMLLHRYLELCRDKNITFTVDAGNCDVRYLKPAELIKLLSFLLDGAISSASGSTNPYIHLRISDAGSKNTIISVDSSCDNTSDTGLRIRRDISDMISGYGGSFLSRRDDRGIHTIINMFH